jgi:signal transduction histidine kinase
MFRASPAHEFRNFHNQPRRTAIRIVSEMFKRQYNHKSVFFVLIFMSILITLLDRLPAPVLPGFTGWLGWALLLAALLWMLWLWRHFQTIWTGRSWALLAALAITIPITSLFFGMRFPSGGALPIPNLPEEPRGPALMIFSALPWMLAAGMIGPWGAAALGFFAGLIRFFWDSHSIFTPIEMAFLAAAFSAMIRQRYRTIEFQVLREPVAAALALTILYIPVFVLNSFLVVFSDSLASGLDYALTRIVFALVTGGELLIAGIFAQAVAMAFPAVWGRKLPLQPSPAEQSLETKFVIGTGSLILFLLLSLLIGDWIVAGNAARSMLRDRMKGTAELAAQNIPFFLETGQNLAVKIAAHPNLISATGDVLTQTLSTQLRSEPYFTQLLVYDLSGIRLAAYPSSSEVDDLLSPEETQGVLLAYNGVLNQMYTLPPSTQGGSARIAFITSVIDPSAPDRTARVLIARTDLLSNPYTQPLIRSLQSLSELDGAGSLIDENGRILYHPVTSLIMSDYPGERGLTPSFFDSSAPDGTRSLVYYQPAQGKPWSVALIIPARQAQQLSLGIAAPLSIMLIVLSAIALIALRFGLRAVTNSLQTLASEAMRIAQGQLDHPLQIDGVDEVGQLRRSFEQMRVSLHQRLEELNRLLLVSQGVASSLEMRDAVQPVLEAVLASGASAARVVMASASILPDLGESRTEKFTLGASKDLYAYLDDQIMMLARINEKVVVPNVNRSRELELNPQKAKPASLIAVSLKHENRFYGVLWAAYDQQRAFADADVRFITTLAGQAALAATNARLFLSAEVGRQRLSAILDSTPDPVLVTDQFNRLLLANPAAWQALGAGVSQGEGQPVDRTITQKALIDVLQASSSDKLSAEITVPSGQTFLATASPVIADGRLVGRVCILRDVTHFKEVDTMKTEFVNTVSHDLRSPLTLMRGYATMLEMVGELNEQQKTYAGKIVVGVENMSRLVNNLLDLGRVEAGVGLQLEIVPLLDLIDNVINPLQMQAQNKQIDLALETPKGAAPMIEADKALFQQSMYNLVENAIKYTKAGGSVRVRLSLPNDEMLFEVKDSGIGIPSADLPRLFEKFYRGSNREAREQKGSGLGLAIVKSIAERHGGKVWVESEEGKGSTFFLQAPLKQPKA